MKQPMDYLTHHRKDYDEPSARGYTSIPCLEFLIGQPWNHIALNYVHALRPSCIRVTDDEVTSDSVRWRVTVFVDSLPPRTSLLACSHAATICAACVGVEPIIKAIEQEVEVGTEGIVDQCGAGLSAALSKQGGKIPNACA